MINIPQQQIPGVYHRRVGDIVVTAISDGFLDGSMQVLRNITVDEATSILASSFRSTTVAEEQFIRLRDVATGKELRTLKDHSDAVHGLYYQNRPWSYDCQATAQ